MISRSPIYFIFIAKSPRLYTELFPHNIFDLIGIDPNLQKARDRKRSSSHHVKQFPNCGNNTIHEKAVFPLFQNTFREMELRSARGDLELDGATSQRKNISIF